MTSYARLCSCLLCNTLFLFLTTCINRLFSPFCCDLTVSVILTSVSYIHNALFLFLNRSKYYDAKNSSTLFMLLLYVYQRKLKIVAPCSCTRKGLAVKVGKLYTCLLRIIDNHFPNGDSITPHFLGPNNIVTPSSLLPGAGSSLITLPLLPLFCQERAVP